MIQQESGFQEGVKSPAGAQDIAQFMPATAKAYGVTLGDGKVTDDLDGAARYLSDNLKKFGSYAKALSVYNSGKPDAYKDPNFSGGQTYNYVKTILGAAGGEPKTSPKVSPKTSPTYSTQTTTTPAVNYGAQRLGLVQNFLSQGGIANPNAIPYLAQANQLQDVPASSTTTRVKVSGQTPAPKGSYSAGGATGSKVLELIHNDGSGKPGYGIKNGQVVNGSQVFSGVWAGHANHVHVAAGPETVVALGKLAQSMGLHVGENPHFGGVTPVHVPGSYHYKGEAIDVSGDPKKMDAFSRAVEQYNRSRQLPQ